MQPQLLILLTFLSTVHAIPTPQIIIPASPSNPWTAAQPQQVQPPAQLNPPKTGPPPPSVSFGPNGISLSGPLGTYHNGPDGVAAQGAAGSFEQTRGPKGTTTTMSNGLGGISVGPNGVSAGLNPVGGRGPN
jgi:hypothetical protein